MSNVELPTRHVFNIRANTVHFNFYEKDERGRRERSRSGHSARSRSSAGRYQDDEEDYAIILRRYGARIPLSSPMGMGTVAPRMPEPTAHMRSHTPGNNIGDNLAPSTSLSRHGAESSESAPSAPGRVRRVPLVGLDG